MNGNTIVNTTHLGDQTTVKIVMIYKFLFPVSHFQEDPFFSEVVSAEFLSPQTQAESLLLLVGIPGCTSEETLRCPVLTPD